MRLFFRKICLCVFLVFALLTIYNVYLDSVVRRVNTLSPVVRVLAMGDSHIECGVNDKLYPIFSNRASSSENFYFNYQKMKSIVEQNKETIGQTIDAVCLSYNFASCAEDRDSTIISDDYWIAQFIPIYKKPENLPTKFNVPIIGNEYVLLLRAYLPEERFKPLYRTNIGGYRGGYIEHYNTLDSAKEGYITHKINMLTHGKDNLEYISPLQIKLLRIIAEYAKSNDIELFLVNTPLHADYTAKVPNELKLFHGELAQKLHDEYGAIYLDYHTMEMPDSCFKDNNHLNSNGAKIFTPRLLEDVTLNMQRLGKW